MDTLKYAICIVTERRTEMRVSNLQTHVTDQFVLTLKEQGIESVKPHRREPVLYLKCWGSDYLYLRGVEQQKRWLPVPVDSAPGI
jgi:hypothetical protein